MGLDIRKPIGLLFAVIAAELLAFEALKLVGGAASATSMINTWCALAFAALGAGMLWLSR